MNYKKVNTYLGWLIFIIATTVFFITIEDTVSLWDCGEYITAAYKLEVGHPPGAPLFMVLGRLFSFFADPESVAVWINRLSALSSSLTILFMFWSLTMLIKRLALRTKASIDDLSLGDKVAIFGAAAIGSLAYTFSESFWFSAVEGEVYAMSSLFTAIIFWAILKWDEEMIDIKDGRIPQGYSPDRWLLLIMFMLGLAIGVHLLGILVVPAIVYIIYFRYAQSISIKNFLLVGILSIVILGFIQEGVIPGSISIASSFEVSFVNSFGLPFFTGTIFFFLLLTGLCIFLIRYARKKGNRILYSSVMGLILLLIGYGSFAVIVIRSNANPPLDENDPENLVTLHAYLKREQYGSAPILTGPFWNSKANSPDMYDDLSPFYLRRFVVRKGDRAIKAFQDEAAAKEFSKTVRGTEVKEMYYESNEHTRENAVPTYAQTTFFPRMYWSQDQNRISGYKKWSGYNPLENKDREKGSDGLRIPTMGENMTYFFDYQVNWMYWRYFMWNFTGRQNDFQGHGDLMRGNWLSGVAMIDNARLGDQGENAPYFTAENPSNNHFYFLPLILGIIGLIFHFYRSPKDAFVVLLAFLFTGLAIIIYLNQKPYEPRERDYAYAGSFFFFAMWIGIGAYALYEAYKEFGKTEFKKIGIVAGAGLILTLIADIGSPESMPSTLSWLFMVLIGALAIGVMVGVRNVLKKDVQGAGLMVLLCAAVPLIMAFEGWDDHDRSLKTTAHNVALNYLNSVEKNGILFTNGDNDTFPLWYMQEVEEKRTDVRVCNLSLMQTDWYTNQMKMKAYDSDPLPIKFKEDQILMYAGNTDQVLFTGLFDLFFMNASDELRKEVIALRAMHNLPAVNQAVMSLNAKVSAILSSASAKDPRAAKRLATIKTMFNMPLGENVAEDIFGRYKGAIEVLSGAQANVITLSEAGRKSLQQAMLEFEKPWNAVILADAMEFTRNDDFLIKYQGERKVRVFPSTSFILPVNAKNAVESGLISKDDEENCLDALQFDFEGKRGLTREQVMMLDIMANNEWKRSIAFSSPGGSDVSIALYKRGYIKQNGMVFELSPLNNLNDRYNSEKMYANLMEGYDYGAMNNPDVLTDYYARRHSDQYRLHFSSLAQDFVDKANQAESQNAQMQRFIEMNPDAAATVTLVPQKEIDENKQKAIDLILRSLEVMPADLVLDYGEPQRANDPNDQLEINGKRLGGFMDGSLHDHVRILYMAGDKENAEKLGAQVAEQLESIIAYYEKSVAHVALRNDNTEHLYASLVAYIEMMASAFQYGDDNSTLAKRISEKMDYYYNEAFPSIKNRLKEAANENGESTRRGSKPGNIASMLFSFEDFTDAIAIRFNLLEPQSTSADELGGGPSLQDLINQQAKQDSTEP